MKNKLTKILIVMTILNFIISLVMLFTILPKTNETNKMIKEVCKSLDIQLQREIIDTSEVHIDSIEILRITKDGNMVINLADGEHYAVIDVSLSINKDSERYKKESLKILNEHESIIKSIINETVCTYSKQDLLTDKKSVQNEICEKIQSLYGEDYVVGVNLSELTLH